MRIGEPDSVPPEAPEQRRSLADGALAGARAAARAGARRWRRLRARPFPRVTLRGGGVDVWRTAAAAGALVAAVPLLTLAGAWLLEAREAAALARVERAAAPLRMALRADAEARALLARALRTPGAGTTVEALARALPPDAGIAAVARDRAGALHVEIVTPDPDRLRASLRREPLLARLREAGQRKADAGMRVTLREVRR